MTNPVKFALQSDGGEQKFINIEPDADAEGGSHSNGVYRLYFGGKEHRYIGDIAFHQEGADEWIYTGYDLSDNEQEQVALYIQQYENESIGDQSFYVQAFYNGGMQSFEIIPNEGHFGIAYVGNIIAEIQQNENWEQVSGEPLDEDVFTSIKQGIEGHYD